MILVASSIWVNHLRSSDTGLGDLLRRRMVLTHPFVVGELVCGGLPRCSEVLALMTRLPGAELAAHEEVLSMVEQERLVSAGIGWIDAHLLASAMLSDAGVWTRDRAMARAATRLGISADLA